MGCDFRGADLSGLGFRDFNEFVGVGIDAKPHHHPTFSFQEAIESQKISDKKKWIL